MESFSKSSERNEGWGGRPVDELSKHDVGMFLFLSLVDPNVREVIDRLGACIVQRESSRRRLKIDPVHPPVQE